ncbi:MAG: replication-associated recombination protein A [Myxococcota bacterium]|nr:replication-associated recombination protein A [Myxococcota bacterium]
MPPEDPLELFPSSPGGPDPNAPLADGGDPRVDPKAPLADRMRPRRLDEVVGQQALVGPDGPLRALAASGELPSLILWGPPGCGKTTLARLLATATNARLEALSAVMAGVKDIREAVARARRVRHQRTVLLLDEIHRLNRAQQDALLPHVEAGTVTLLGATTENPSFEVNAPLLSRCRVYTLERLAENELVALLRRAAADSERGLAGLRLDDEVAAAVAHAADGDARRALGLLEAAAALHRAGDAPEAPLSVATVQDAAGRRLLVHDRDREEHYNVASAFIKSLRASDPDAALYYAARMLEAGDDPLFLCRRMVIFASEDVGNADPQALTLATSTWQAVERIGMPEGRIPIGQAVTYLACAPKSNAAYRAIDRAREAVSEQGSLPVPMHLRNAPTGLMKREGYGRGYEYPHDAEDGFVATRNLPEPLQDAVFYEPKEAGAEAETRRRLAGWRERRRRP